MNVSIALCTYNGEKFLAEQLDSIRRQSRLPDEMVICDDRSSDGTLDILREFARSAPFEVRLFPNETNLGPVGNFAKAMSQCRGEWIVLCDQDDCWLPEKLATTGRKMAELEAACGAGTPLLVHSDARVADAELRVIADSLWAFQHSFPAKGHPLGRLLNQNLVTGCTAALNRALRDRALPLPAEAVMHDWWLALVAAAFGRIGCIPEPTLLYRQHGRNDTGARAWGFMHAVRSVTDFRNREYVLKADKEGLRRSRKQAGAFLARYAPELSSRQRATLKAFIELGEHGYLARKYLIVRYGLHYQGLLRNLGNLLLK